MSKGRATSAEKEMRLNITIKLLNDGRSYSEIFKYLSQKFKINERSAKEYISQARKKIKSKRVDNKELELSLTIARLELHYESLKQKGDDNGCVRVLGRINDLRNKFERQKLKSTMKKVDAEQIQDNSDFDLRFFHLLCEYPQFKIFYVETIRKNYDNFVEIQKQSERGIELTKLFLLQMGIAIRNLRANGDMEELIDKHFDEFDRNAVLERLTAIELESSI